MILVEETRSNNLKTVIVKLAGCGGVRRRKRRRKRRRRRLLHTEH